MNNRFELILVIVATAALVYAVIGFALGFVLHSMSAGFGLVTLVYAVVAVGLWMLRDE